MTLQVAMRWFFAISIVVMTSLSAILYLDKNYFDAAICCIAVITSFFGLIANKRYSKAK